MSELKFSGHDTFHCRQQWLSKGVQFIDSQDYNEFNKTESAISTLGVGKNMVQSIQHWLKAFGLVVDGQITEIGNLLFIRNGGLDSFLEDEGTLWLLQYLICKTSHASIFSLIFSEYFKERANLEFSENQVINFLHKKVREYGDREVSSNTLTSDFKVFVKSYVTPAKSLKTIEDDFNSPLIELNLISQLKERNSNNEISYKINKEVRNDIPIQIFAYCLLDICGSNNSMKYTEIRDSIGAFFCLSNEGLDNLIDMLCETHSEFIYKNDAGIRQLQIKGIDQQYKLQLLQTYYGV
jgi:hypothetical protein